jgi:hypothetical protein
VKLSIREAFTLEPVLNVTIGGAAYAVPPLTFGRFDELLKAARAVTPAALDLRGFLERVGDTPEAVGRALAYFPHEAFADAAAAVVPGMTREKWAEVGTPYAVLELLQFFSKVHDWAFIGEAMFGRRPGESEASDLDMQTAVLLMSRELGNRIGETLELRVEGFFVSAAAIRSKFDALEAAREKADREAEGWSPPQPAAEVVGVVKDPVAAARLGSILDQADAQAPAEGGENG